MERDILVDILERKASLLARTGRPWPEALTLAAKAIVDGVDGRWPPHGVMLLRASLAMAGGELRAAQP